MRTVSYRIGDLGKATIHIGRVAENDYTRVQIDAGEIFAEYPHAAAALTVQPPAGEAYPAVVTREGDLVIWDVPDSALTEEGMGEIQLTFTADEVVVKSAIGRISVCRSIVGEGEAPDPLEDFLAEAGAALTAIPETIGAALEEAKESGEFDGPAGPAGADGADGFSPVVTVSEISGGHSVSVTDADGTQTFNVMDGVNGQDGQPGADGYSPSASVTKSGSTATIVITDKDGTTTAQISDGEGADVIDDTAGSGDTDKTWSADKLSSLNSALSAKISEPQTEGTSGQVLTTDGNGGRSWTTVQGGGGGTSNYADLTNKPQINGVTLSGNKSASDLGLLSGQGVADAVDDWCDENITNPDSPPLDRSLTSSSAAAPADMVGVVKNGLYDELGYDVLYDAIDDNLTSHSGLSDMKYGLNIVIPKNRATVLSAKVYADCTFSIWIISKSTKTVIGIETFSLTEGINTFKLQNLYGEDAYIGITGEANTILYKSSGDHQVKYVSSTGNWSVGKTISDPSASANSFTCALKVVTTKDISGRVEELEHEVSNLNDDMSSITGGTYSSMPFEYNSSAGSISSFMLLQPAPYDGLITKVHFKQGATQANVGLAVYEWTDTSSLSNIVKKKEYYVICINGVADTAIKIKKGQYIGIFFNVSSTCSWYNNASGAGFVYMPTTQSVDIYEGKYITLSYDMTIDSASDPLIVSPLKDNVVFLAGDSRSSDDYSFYWSTLTKKTGADVLVKGASGKVASYIASNTYFADVIANPHDFSIWIVGGNDAGRSGEVGTFSATSPNGIAGEDVVQETDITQDYSGTKFIQAIDHIIRKYRSLFYDFKTKNDGHKYRMIMCTDLPQQRNNSSDDYSQKANWERKVNAIIEACEKNNIPCLDLYHKCAFDMSQEPYWTSPTDKTTDNGIYFMDGLHPNQYGIDIITSLEVEEMKKYVSINPYTAPGT